VKKFIAAALTALLLLAGCGEPDGDDDVVDQRPAHGEPGHNHPEDHQP
jgi:PBP1b-binding outer membrane lipoprotein LpoB